MRVRLVVLPLLRRARSVVERPQQVTLQDSTATSSFTATGLVTNTDLVNSSMTVGGATCTLGGSCSPSGTSLTVTDGSTSVTSTTNATFGTGFKVSGTTGTATINLTTAVSPQAGSSYTINATDNNKTVNRTNSGAMTDTLPAVGTTGFGTGFGFSLCTAAGSDTLTSSSNIGGAGSLSIPANTCVAIADLDNATYVAFVPTAGVSVSANNIWTGTNTFNANVFPPHPAALTSTGNLDPTGTAMCGGTVEYNSGSAGSLHVLSTWPVGCNVSVTTIGTGLATVDAGSGTVHSACTTGGGVAATTRARYSTIWVRSSNTGGAGVVDVSGDCS